MLARFALCVQLAAAPAALLALVVAPPSAGRMLLLPITPGAATGLAALVVARGGQLLGPGPVTGSLIVEGERARLTAGLATRGVIALAATGTDCGPGPRP